MKKGVYKLKLVDWYKVKVLFGRSTG